MSDTVGEYIERFRAIGLDGSPCSPADVAQVEKDAGTSLPAAYKAYLLIAGRAPPIAWIGSDCTLEDLPKLSGYAEDLLAENRQPPLPTQAFVFIVHQAYQFFYFIADGCSDDPPVYYYLEGEPAVVRRFERLSDLMVVVAHDGRHA